MCVKSILPEFAYHLAGCVECGQMNYTECSDGTALHEVAKAADDVLAHPIRSARVSQLDAEGEAAGSPLTPRAAWVERALRRQMAMYDWSDVEAMAITDFILTVREGVAEELSKPRKLLRSGASGREGTNRDV